ARAVRPRIAKTVNVPNAVRITGNPPGTIRDRNAHGQIECRAASSFAGTRIGKRPGSLLTTAGQRMPGDPINLFASDRAHPLFSSYGFDKPVGFPRNLYAPRPNYCLDRRGRPRPLCRCRGTDDPRTRQVRG